MGFCERVDLMAPNIRACAPAGNKNQRSFVARLARFNHSQRDAFTDIHLSLA
jgi:hypothetical protein